jgi:hypothetical protein
MLIDWNAMMSDADYTPGLSRSDVAAMDLAIAARRVLHARRPRTVRRPRPRLAETAGVGRVVELREYVGHQLK